MNDQRKRQAEAKQDEHFPVAWPHNGEPTSKKEVETRIAEAVKRERARILDVARNWNFNSLSTLSIGRFSSIQNPLFAACSFA